ncbi:hypothetical protein AX774_g7578 [Zancudomyces culisetae]|uniref:Uncharacterized protein n=1 Tax=Zancudomyces culisetae TaxID=1213189 RepID=A0A1R1PDI6_ZANCU|nr:hypothetical protein AX774_g7578 [Zancudomyces culisetae]|eukprot:OMH79026.1 hypothetical protein AX774_g7578 [Zancudomyces culisetae]
MNFYEKPGAIEHVSVQKSQEGIEHHVDIDNKLNRKPDFAQRRSTISESNHGICKGKKSITNYNDTVASIKNGNDSLPVADTLSPKTHDQTCKGIHIRIRQDSKLERDESYDAGNENSLAIPSTIRCNQAEPIFPENGSHNHIDRTMKKRVKVSFDEFLKNTSDSGCFESNLYKTSSPLHLDVTNNPDFEQTPGDSIERSDLISTQILNSDSEPLVDTMRSDSTENEIVNRLVSPKSKVYRDVERTSVHFRDNSQGVQALPTTSNGVFVHEMSTANSSYGSKIACYKQDNSKLQTNEPTFYNFSVCTEETDPIQTTFNNKNQLDVQLNRGYKPLNISPSTPEAFWDVDFPET